MSGTLPRQNLPIFSLDIP
jgi:hypothetical protein